MENMGLNVVLSTSYQLAIKKILRKTKKKKRNKILSKMLNLVHFSTDCSEFFDFIKFSIIEL